MKPYKISLLFIACIFSQAIAAEPASSPQNNIPLALSRVDILTEAALEVMPKFDTDTENLKTVADIIWKALTDEEKTEDFTAQVLARIDAKLYAQKNHTEAVASWLKGKKESSRTTRLRKRLQLQLNLMNISRDNTEEWFVVIVETEKATKKLQEVPVQEIPAREAQATEAPETQQPEEVQPTDVMSLFDKTEDLEHQESEGPNLNETDIATIEQDTDLVVEALKAGYKVTKGFLKLVVAGLYNGRPNANSMEAELLTQVYHLTLDPTATFF